MIPGTKEFEDRTDEVWPLNGEDGPQKAFRITSAGERELAGWLRTPPDLSSPPRDELVMKVLMALRMPGTDPHEAIQAPRRQRVLRAT